MAFPSGTYINQIQDPAVRAELEQLYSLFQGFLSKEHKDSGAHDDVTADTLTLAQDTAHDGAWTGNVTASLVPTNSAVDLGATNIPKTATGTLGQHPFRNLLLSGSLSFADYSDNGITSRPTLSRSGSALTITYPPGTTGTPWTLTITSGEQVTWSSLGVLSSKIVTGTSNVNAGTLGFFERSRSTALGEWISFTPTRTASAGTWTVGTVTDARYTLIGKTMIVKFRIDNSSVSATPAQLKIAIPGGFTAANDTIVGSMVYNDNGAGFAGGGAISVSSGGTVIDLQEVFGTSTWAISVTATSVMGEIAFEVQ